MSRKRYEPGDEPFFLIRTMRSSMRDGHAIAPHAHEWHQLIYAATGVMTVTADRGLWVVPPQWAIWAPAGVPHAIRFSGAATFATLYLRPTEWEGMARESGVVSVSPLLRELIARACEEGMLDAREPVHRAIALLIVDALHSQSVPALALPNPGSELLRRIAVECAEDDASTAAIARRYGIGVRTLERTFLAETGMTFGQWRRHARFLHALELLAGGATVKEVAFAAGYQSASAFVAAFAAVFETTPGRYFANRK